MTVNMPESKVENLLGAFTLAVSDEIIRTTQRHLEISAPSSALVLIYDLSGLTIEQLSGILRMSHAGTVRLIDRLEAESLVKRQRALEDKRAVALQLTEQGVELAKSILASRQAGLSSVLAILSENEKQQLGEMLEKLLKSLVKTSEDAVEICRLCHHINCIECPVQSKVIEGK